ncbi:hypothetical protein SUGI_0577830 [Cryptomeria japonica]|nr:hypothetical protein SUGI_0577830 [Cryptomeria japonica]
MASRLQRALSLARVFSTASSAFSARSSSPALAKQIAGSALFNPPLVLPFRFLGSRFFSDLDYGSLDESNSFTTITPDGKKRSTLFEGTDYNHWMVTMEFPDPQPTKEEKIAAFEKTLANIVGGLEEAKKRIYIVCTTVYTGFKCEMSEELAQVMEKQPGVTWVLPDSYADPKTKTYGGTGDRYNMGVLTPDPNAHTYNRPSGRYNDRPMNRRRDSLPLERNRNVPGYSSPPRQDYGRGQDYSPPPRQGYGRGQDYSTPPRGPMPTSDREPMEGQQGNVTGTQGRDPVQGNN